MRGAGGCGVTGRAGATGEALAETGGGATAAGICATGGAGRGGCAAVGAGGVGCNDAGGATTGRAGIAGAAAGDALTVTCGVEAGLATGGATVVGRLTVAGGTPADFSTGVCVGSDAGRGGAAASFFWVIALSTSPGREMFERSILVLISSSPRRGRELDLPAADDPSAEERMYTRTFSASCSSRELECVFFSVTPTSGSVSRMALLLTSSSRARSLIRTLLIRPFDSPCCS
jgi:hypothetical protein